jgi:hypothetical protein
MSTDKYFHPTTIKKCHERIDGMVHTNKSQAEHIATLQSRLHTADLERAKAQAIEVIVRVKFNNLLGDYKALKLMLGMLARDEVLDFLPRIEPLDSKGESR